MLVVGVLLLRACGGAESSDVSAEAGPPGDAGEADVSTEIETSTDGPDSADATDDVGDSADTAETSEAAPGDAWDVATPDGPDGGGPTCNAESYQFGPWTFEHAFAASPTHVFFSKPSAGKSAVLTRSKSGGALTELFQVPGVVSALATIDSALLVLTRGSDSQDGALLAYSLPSGPLVALASALGPLESLATDGAHAYVARRADPGAVLRVPVAGGSLESLAGPVSKPYQLALNSSALFWLTWGSGSTVWRVPKTGGTPTQLVDGVSRFTVDETTIYYSQAGYVRVRPLAGGAPWTLAAASPRALRVWGDELLLKGDCRITVVAKIGGPLIHTGGLDCSDGTDAFAVDDGCFHFMHGSSKYGIGTDGEPSWTWTGYLDRVPRP